MTDQRPLGNFGLGNETAVARGMQSGNVQPRLVVGHHQHRALAERLAFHAQRNPGLVQKFSGPALHRALLGLRIQLVKTVTCQMHPFQGMPQHVRKSTYCTPSSSHQALPPQVRTVDISLSAYPAAAAYWRSNATRPFTMVSCTRAGNS